METPAHAELPAPLETGLSERHQQVLGCLACISSNEPYYATEATRQIAACTELSRHQVMRSLNYLQEQELVDVRPRTQPPKPGTRGPSYTEHGLTPAGRDVLPAPAEQCDRQKSDQPLAGITKLQKSFLRCVSCLMARGKEPTSIDIGSCNSRDPSVVNTMLGKFTQADLLDRTIVTERPRQHGGRDPICYTPTDKAQEYMPKAPSVLFCPQFSKEADTLYASFTDQQRQVLGCLACLWGKANRKEIAGAENSLIADCQDISLSTVIPTTARFVDLGIVEAVNGLSKTRNKTIFTPTDLGRKIFTLTTNSYTCSSTAQQAAGEVVHLESTVTKCLGCIWTKQIATEEKPAATNAMIAHCSGLSLKSVQIVTRRLVTEGRVKRGMSPYSVLHDKWLPTVTYEPSAYARALPGTGGKSCNLPLYTAVPQHFLSPLTSDTFKVPPPHSVKGVYESEWFKTNFNHSILSAQEEVDLARIIQTSDDPEEVDKAIATFVQHNFKLAAWGVTLAKGDRLFLPLEDALQVALRAIGHAAQRFDPDRGTKFSTYAPFWIRQHLQRETANSIGVPTGDYVLFSKMYYTAHDFKDQYGRYPSVVELSRELQMRPQQVSRILERRQHAVRTLTGRLDDYIDSHEQSKTYHHLIGHNDTNFEQVDINASLELLCSYLNPTEVDYLANLVHDLGLSGKAIVKRPDGSQGNYTRVRNKVASLIRHPYFGILAMIDGAFEWQEEAACSARRHDQVVKTSNRPITLKTKEVCQTCPVLAQCSSYAKNAQPPVTAGVWGGQRYVTPRS